MARRRFPIVEGGATNPFRLDRSQAVTSDQDHDYDAEQQAYDKGAMELFPLQILYLNRSSHFEMILKSLKCS